MKKTSFQINIRKTEWLKSNAAYKFFFIIYCFVLTVNAHSQTVTLSEKEYGGHIHLKLIGKDSSGVYFLTAKSEEGFIDKFSFDAQFLKTYQKNEIYTDAITQQHYYQKYRYNTFIFNNQLTTFFKAISEKGYTTKWFYQPFNNKKLVCVDSVAADFYEDLFDKNVVVSSDSKRLAIVSPGFSRRIGLNSMMYNFWFYDKEFKSIKYNKISAPADFMIPQEKEPIISVVSNKRIAYPHFNFFDNYFIPTYYIYRYQKGGSSSGPHFVSYESYRAYDQDHKVKELFKQENLLMCNVYDLLNSKSYALDFPYIKESTSITNVGYDSINKRLLFTGTYRMNNDKTERSGLFYKVYDLEQRKYIAEKTIDPTGQMNGFVMEDESDVIYSNQQIILQNGDVVFIFLNNARHHKHNKMCVVYFSITDGIKWRRIFETSTYLKHYISYVLGNVAFLITTNGGSIFSYKISPEGEISEKGLLEGYTFMPYQAYFLNKFQKNNFLEKAYVQNEKSIIIPVKKKRKQYIMKIDFNN